MKDYWALVNLWRIYRRQTTVHTFYNNGRNLYCDLQYNPPIYFYTEPLHHLLYKMSCNGVWYGTLLIKHLGHHGEIALVDICVSGQWEIQYIPTMHILQVLTGPYGSAVHLRPQPLPWKLVPSR
jgi:hypothetical protein